MVLFLQNLFLNFRILKNLLYENPDVIAKHKQGVALNVEDWGGGGANHPGGAPGRAAGGAARRRIKQESQESYLNTSTD